MQDLSSFRFIARSPKLFHFRFSGTKPRLRGQMPREMGKFQRIAPSVMWDKIYKLKRMAYSEPQTLEYRYRSTYPIVV